MLYPHRFVAPHMSPARALRCCVRPIRFAANAISTTAYTLATAVTLVATVAHSIAITGFKTPAVAAPQGY